MQISNDKANKAHENKNTLSTCSSYKKQKYKQCKYRIAQKTKHMKIKTHYHHACNSYKKNNLPVNKNIINTHGGVNTIANGSKYKAT